jgi:hypothetical protein
MESHIWYIHTALIPIPLAAVANVSGFRPSNASSNPEANRTSFASYADAEMELMAGMRVGGALRFENTVILVQL